MQQSRLFSVLFAVLAFGFLAFASPVAKSESTDLVVRTGGNTLDVILALILKLQLDIKAILDVCGKP